MHKFHRLKRRTADDVHSEDEDDADLDQRELPSDEDDIDDDASSVSEESASEESEEDEDAHHTDYRFVEQNKIKLTDIGDEAVEVLDFKDIGPQWKDAKQNTAMTTEQFPSLPWLNSEMKSDEGEEDGDLGENESSIASDVNESKDIFPHKSADSTSRASKEDATPDRSSYPQQRRPNQPNPYQKRFQERREYHKKLAEDPSFVPHLGEFWGHDDRFREEGLRNVELPGMADRWGARGGSTRGRVAGGVGMHGGYAHVRGTGARIAGRGGRGGRGGTANPPFTDGVGRGRTPMGPGPGTGAGTNGSASGAGVGAVAVAVAVAGPGSVASQATSTQEKWQHDGFEELMRMEEVEDQLRRERLEKREKLERLRLAKQEDRERAQARFVGRGGYGRGFRGRGRGRGVASVSVPRAIDRGFLPQNLAPPSRAIQANVKAEAETISHDEQKSEGQSIETKVERAPSATLKRQNHNRGEVQGISRMLSKALPRTDPASSTGSTASGELEPVRGRHNMNGKVTATSIPATSSTIASTSATTKVRGSSSQKKGSTTSVTAEEGGYRGTVPNGLVEGERASRSRNGRASTKDVGNGRPVDKQQVGDDGEEEDEEEDSDVEIILDPEVAGEHPEQVLGIANPTPRLWPAQSEGGDHIDTSAELVSKQEIRSWPNSNGSILRASAKEWRSASSTEGEEKDNELLVATTANGENSKSGKRIPDVSIPQNVSIATQETHTNPTPGNKGKDKPVKTQLPHTPGKVEVPMSSQGWVAHPNGTVIGTTSHLGMMYPPDAMIMGQSSFLMGVGMGYLPHNGYPAVHGYPSPLFVPPRPVIENRRPLVIRAPPTTSAPGTSSSSGTQPISSTLPISSVYAMPFQPATTEPPPGPVYYPTPQTSNSQQQPQQPSVMSPSVSNSATTNPALEGNPPTTTYEANGMVYYNPYESLPPPVYYYYSANTVPGFDTTSTASMGGSYVPVASGSGNNAALSQEGMNGWGTGEEMSWSEGENNWGAEQQGVVEEQGRPSSGMGVVPTSGAGSANMYYYYPMYYQ